MGGGSVKERARLTPVSCPFAPLVTEAAADARQASLEAAAVELSAHPHGHTLHKPPGNAGPSAGVSFIHVGTVQREFFLREGLWLLPPCAFIIARVLVLGSTKEVQQRRINPQASGKYSLRLNVVSCSCFPLDSEDCPLCAACLRTSLGCVQCHAGCSRQFMTKLTHFCNRVVIARCKQPAEHDAGYIVLYLVLFLWVQALLAPKSVYTLPGLWHGSTSFAGFGDGSGLLEGKDGAEIREELSERVRNLGEACDLLQGFQMLVDDLSGFGGIATHLAEEVRINWERKQ
eukprot:scaffold64642_cov21-Tisochrysis_lutea.AAC.1